jgi:hypothetical protein
LEYCAFPTPPGCGRNKLSSWGKKDEKENRNYNKGEKEERLRKN